MKKTVFSVATLTALTGTSLTANAEEVIVKEGDTLWGIANEVGTTVEKLKELNNLNSDLIHPEDVLTYEVEAVEEQKGNTYTVKAGDTLWQIALDHGMDLDELFAVNNLSSDLIHPGLVLTVGSQVEAVEEVAQVEEVVEVEAVEEVVEPVVENEVNEVASGVYHIQAGDTLYSISRATGLSVDELKALNGLTSDHIVAGDVLVLEGNPVVTETVEEVQTEEVVEQVEEVQEVQTEEVAEVENNVQAEAEKAVEEATAAQAEADRIAAEEAAAAQAEAERVAAEQVAAAQKAEEQRIAAERAEAQRVAKEKAAAEKRAQQEAAKKVQQAQQQQAPAASAPSVNSSQFAGLSNYYDWGWCTWHVFEKRAALGKPVSNMWGNANNWVNGASANGFAVNNTPSVGAVAQSYAGTNGAGALGHVAVVESINGDGSITISEMGWNGTVGVVSYRTIPASQVSTFNYIH
ncbi:LysM peptidoglycan-binding domain-containing protein [Nosocomiicoccus sp. HMSC059G07]|uniref:LysM peptidoglycan-binding domain-containing protein n=1 Tax=Nosocomiicoccus sp. HMSC059G07 TaxID=1739531 RepID=UPI0008A32B7D|nr:LysM peptidoglycan-binding domain-containing protein [Nosocomiicoccus sp. HMSC059G07]OFO53029.1 hypothetical protein HMPREF3029_01580 [Nosocomiicoccus sp. HMSC059G07]